MSQPQAPVLLFDGVCNLCNGAVQFVIRHDRSGSIRFASLQSAVGQQLLAQYGLSTTSLHSLVFIHQGRAHTRSAGALAVARVMGGLWRLAAVGHVLPAVVRDALYDWVARNRYRWFGKRQEDACLLPTPALKARMLS